MLRWIVALAAPLSFAQPRGAIGVDQAREEVRMVRQSLEQGHPGLYDYIPKQKLDSLFDAAERSFTKPTNGFEIYRRLAPVVASIRCVHTTFILPNQLWPASHRVFPFRIAVRDKRLYAIASFAPPPSAIPAGSEILSINGIAAAALLDTMLAVVAVDGFSNAAPERLGQGGLFPKLLVDMAGVEAPYRISYLAPGAKTPSAAAVEGLERDRFPLLPAPGDPLTFAEGGRVAVLRTRAIWAGAGRASRMEEIGLRVSRLWDHLRDMLGLPPDPPPPRFGERIGEAFDRIARQRAAALVIDLRGDLGGDDVSGAQLLGHLVDKPFAYYRDLIANSLDPPYHRWANPKPAVPPHWFEKTQEGKWRYTATSAWGTQPPRGPRFAGPVVVLVDGTTASGACEFLSVAVSRGRVLVAGSETAGVYRGNTSGFSARIPLPHSRIVLTVPEISYRMAVDGARDGNRPVPLDVPTIASIGELASGADAVLDRAAAAAAGAAKLKPRSGVSKMN